jgi:Relaxase/Mobilisation nuclease domain.
MAIVYAVKEKTQSKTAMSKVMRYVSQDKKTLFEDERRNTVKLVSGQNCCGATAFQKFMATKRRYRKEKGVYFYQYVQSFKLGTPVTPQEIHQMGVELAKYFDGYEVQIATHIDRDHWHNHLVVNSVSCETGLKLQFNERNLEQLRTLSDQICQTHGLEVLKPYQKSEHRPMLAGEYRAAARGGSFKLRLMAAIDQAMKQSRTKAGFIACMAQMGYRVKWEPHYKYITYTTPEGQRCRDNRLHEQKYLKAEMEEYFNAGLRETQAAQPAGERIAPAAEADGRGAVSAAGQRDSDRSVERHAEGPADDRAAASGPVSLRRGSAECGRREQNDGALLPERLLSADREFEGYGPAGEPGDYGIGEYGDGEDEEYDSMDDTEYAESMGSEAGAQGYVPAQNQGEMGGNRGIDFGDVLALAKAVEDLVNPYDPQQEREKPKLVHKKRHKRKKKQVLSEDEEQELSM